MSKKKNREDRDAPDAPNEPGDQAKESEIIKLTDAVAIAESLGDLPADASSTKLEEAGTITAGKDIRVVEITGKGDLSTTFSAREIKPPPKEWVQMNLAFVLMGILGGTILIHYILTTIIVIQVDAKEFDEKYKSLGQIFNTLLPILSGLVSSAITYYFTREIQSAKNPSGETK